MPPASHQTVRYDGRGRYGPYRSSVEHRRASDEFPRKSSTGSREMRRTTRMVNQKPQKNTGTPGTSFLLRKKFWVCMNRTTELRERLFQTLSVICRGGSGISQISFGNPDSTSFGGSLVSPNSIICAAQLQRLHGSKKANTSVSYTHLTLPTKA